MKEFEVPQAVFRAGDAELGRVKGVSSKLISSIRRARHDKRVMQEIEKAAALGVDFVCSHQQEYPDLLRHIYGPPPVLYVKGKILEADRRAIAIVGTRTPTRYGREMTRRICAGLTSRGISVVSGLARGIDGFAHRDVIEQEGRTIAVLGSGIDVIYPPEHQKLCEAVSANGAVVSEFPLGTKPNGGNFPMRNRIISGLSLGTVVIEAAEKSGALITMRMALEDQNRAVFAVPGPVTSPFSRGPNRLIKNNEAKLVESADVILDEIEYLLDDRKSEKIRSDTGRVEEPPAEDVTDTETAILNHLAWDPVHVDEIVRATGLGHGDAASALIALELKDLVECLPGNTYVRMR